MRVVLTPAALRRLAWWWLVAAVVWVVIAIVTRLALSWGHWLGLPTVSLAIAAFCRLWYLRGWAHGTEILLLQFRRLTRTTHPDTTISGPSIDDGDGT